MMIFSEMNEMNEMNEREWEPPDRLLSTSRPVV